LPGFLLKPLFYIIKLMTKKPKVAILSLSSCGGCQIAIFDLGEKFLDLLERVDIGNFPLIEEEPDVPFYDLAFVEGTAISKENFELLEKIRKKSKKVIALGACACIGGVAEIKDYQDRKKVMERVYKIVKGIENPEIKPLKEIIKVDFEIPGCPIDSEEFYQYALELFSSKIPEVPQRPVCYECHLLKKDCFLKKGEICLGPITLGGCQAICLQSNTICSGCRGLIKGLDPKNVKKIYAQGKISKREMEMILERFGLRDEI